MNILNISNNRIINYPVFLGQKPQKYKFNNNPFPHQPPKGIVKRCPNGTRKNKKTGECEKKGNKKRCPNGTRKNKKTGECVKQLINRKTNKK